MVAFFDAGSAYANSGTSVQFTLPDVPEGYGILVCAALSSVSIGDLAISGGDPGETWEPVGPGAVNDTNLHTRVWSRVAGDADAGATITISWTSSGKCAVAWWIGSGVHPVDIVADWAVTVETDTDATHDTLGVTPDLGRCWVVEFVADRGNVATTITAPADRVARVTQLGFGAGTVDMVCADSSGPVLAGVATGAQTYTFDVANANAVGWSILVAPPPLRRRVELALGVDPSADPASWDGSWVDITHLVYARNPINIRGGRADQSTVAGPTRMTLTVNNRRGHLTRTNPLSPYYGRLRKNTPVRVSVEQDGDWNVRGTAFLSEAPPRRHTSGGDPHIPLAADGILRRLGQGKVLRSALFRAITGTAPVAYWSLEDGPTSTQVASALLGGRPLAATGSIRFGESNGPPGSAPLADLASGGRLRGTVPAGSSNTSWRLEYVAKFPNITSGNFITPLNWQTTGTIKTWDLTATDLIDGGPFLQYETAAGVFGGPFFAIAALDDEQWHHIRVSAEQIGSDVLVLVDFDGINAIAEVLAGETLGRITNVTVNPTGSADEMLPSLGHLAIWAPWNAALSDQLVLDAFAGHSGELAADRITRMSAEEGVPLVIVGTAAESEPMGPQPVESYLTIVRECEAADGGVLYEARDGSLAYQTRSARYNAPAVLVLDHEAGDVAPPLEPADDDTDAVNDVEVTRTGGSSARVVDEASVAEIGRYDDGVTLNVATDETLPHHASWRVHLGTVEDLRYPQIAPQLQGRPDVAAAWADVNVGDPITVTNPPPDLPPGDIEVYVEGYTETIAPLRWAAVANCSPAAPWRVAVLDDPILGRLDTDGSELAADSPDTQTDISVSTTSGPLWTTHADDFPFDIVIGGERMTVEDTAGGLLDTFTRTVSNGWGTADTGDVWSTTGGAASDYSVNGSAGLVSLDSVNIRRFTVTPAGSDITIYDSVTVPATATGGSISGGYVARYADDQNFYLYQILHDTAGTIDLQILKRVAGTFTVLGSASNIIPYTPGVSTHVRCLCSGSTLAVKIWADGDTEPADYQLSVTDTEFTAGSVGTHSNLVTGNTNTTPVVIIYDNIRVVSAGITGTTSPQAFDVVRSVNGVVRSHSSGSDARLVQPMILAL